MKSARAIAWLLGVLRLGARSARARRTRRWTSISALVALAGAALTGCSGATGGPVLGPSAPLAPGSPWPKFRCDAQQDGLATVHPRAGGKLWSLRTGRGIFSSPVVAADGTIYIGSADRTFYALDPAGAVRWKLATGEIIDSAALLDDRGRVYFGSGDGQLRALDAATGAPLWSFTADDPARNKAFIRWFEGNVAIGPEGHLYAPNDNFFVYALDRDSGQPLWHFKMGDQTWSLPAVDRTTGELFVGNNNVVSLYGDNVYAIRADGSQDWSSLSLGSVAASPLLTDKAVYVGSFDGYLRAYDRVTGNALWSFATRDHLYASPALLPDGTIVQPSADGTVYALAPDSGALRWAYDTSEPIRSSPAVDADGHIYVGTGTGQLLVLEPDGKRRFALQLIDGDRNDLNSSPALGQQAVYLGGESGEFFSVPYDYCLAGPGVGDGRCRTGDATPLADGAALLSTSSFGGSEAAAQIEANQPLAFSLQVRQGGLAQIPFLDPAHVSVTVQPPAEVITEVSGDGKFLTVTPTSGWTAGADGRVAIGVSAGYLVDTQRVGLKIKGGRPGGTASIALSPAIHPPVAAPLSPRAPEQAGDPTTAWELSRLAVPLPTLLPSYDQIGFDSLHYLIGMVELSGGKGVAWMVGATLAADGTTVIDPATRSLLPLEVSLDRGRMTLANRAGLVVEINNVSIPFRSFRIAAALGDGSGSAVAHISGSTLCAGIPLYGGFLQLLGLCNTTTDLMTIFGAADLALYRGPSAAAIAGASLGTVTWSASGKQVRATVAGSALLLAEHSVAILLVDPATGKPVTLDYGPATTRTADAQGHPASVTLPLLAMGQAATVPASVRAYLMVDAYPAARATLSLTP